MLKTLVQHYLRLYGPVLFWCSIQMFEGWIKTVKPYILYINIDEFYCKCSTQHSTCLPPIQWNHSHNSVELTLCSLSVLLQHTEHSLLKLSTFRGLMCTSLLIQHICHFRPNNLLGCFFFLLTFFFYPRPSSIVHPIMRPLCSTAVLWLAAPCVLYFGVVKGWLIPAGKITMLDNNMTWMNENRHRRSPMLCEWVSVRLHWCACLCVCGYHIYIPHVSVWRSILLSTWE